MKRGYFKRVIIDDEKEEEFNLETWGLTSEYFGIHRTEHNNYRITHLPTGRKVTTLSYQKEARKLVEALEREIDTFPTHWSCEDPEKLKGNKKRFNEVLREAV